MVLCCSCAVLLLWGCGGVLLGRRVSSCQQIVASLWCCVVVALLCCCVVVLLHCWDDACLIINPYIVVGCAVLLLRWRVVVSLW